MTTFTQTHVTVRPTGEAPPIVARLGGERGDVPRLSFQDSVMELAQVDVTLSGHANPARWLRDSAAAMNRLADSIDARTGVHA